jgi:hypothetical protein
MAKTSVAQLPATMFGLLEPLSSEERIRVVHATLILLGEQPVGAANVAVGAPAIGSTPAAGHIRQGTPGDASNFLDGKAPANKGETRAVAARFREISTGAESHSKMDLKAVFSAARRNFDDAHFSRDMDNARRTGGLFISGAGRDDYKLSYYGQQFVDALPDRDVALKIRRPKGRGARKKATKKKSSKK